ncbi:Na+/H+ antiporter subunit G [Halorhodospira abdelmalekii]|nr:monovalent cation/H(+) antiporter subunit G [Halorhodospira abdelmalekii]MBK1734357.1 Na+/H+ antiporter subunit G [Halorhodospira abdelmalekii]
MLEGLTALMLLLGGGLMLIAAIGAVRLPDLPTRLHATTKAGALGAALTIAAVALHFACISVTARAAAVIVFIVLTAPVAAHLIGRAGYFVGVPLWEGTVKDELRDRYDPESHVLRSGLTKQAAESGGKQRGRDA